MLFRSYSVNTSKDMAGLGKIGEKYAVIEDASKLYADYKSYGEVVNKAMKEWNLWSQNVGIVDNKFISDTGELTFDIENRVFTVDTEKFKVYTGDVSKPFSLGRMTFDICNKNMSVSLLTKDDLPLNQSEHILITAVGECCNTDVKRDGDWLLDLGHGPIWIDQIDGTVRIEGINERTRIYALKPNGERRALLSAVYQENCGMFDFTTEEGAIYFEIIKEKI